MVKSIFALLSVRQNSILSGATILMATVVVSKLLGLLRDRLLVHTFTPDVVAIFFAAFRLPDLIFQLVIFGAVSVAFVPIFTDYLENKGEEEAFKMASSILNLAFLALLIIIVAIFFLVEPLTSVIVPGFTEAQKMQVATLTRIILVGQLFLALGAFFSGIAHSFQRFIIPAFAGMFYNVGIILGIVFLSKQLGIMGPAVGVIIGSLLHMGLQIPLLRSLGFRFKLLFFVFHPGAKEITRLMSVRTIGIAAEQINETVGIVLASLISTASVTYLTFAQHLQLVPVGLFGATLAQAALPVLSSESARKRMDEFKVTLLTTFHQILFLVLPATAILIVLRIPAVRLVFGASQFDWPATVLTGKTVALMSIGLAAQAISLLLIRGFYALKDTKTPVLVSLIVVLFNIILSYYFVRVLNLEVWSLGLAFSLSSLLSGTMLFLALFRKIGGFDLEQVLGPLLKMLMAAVIMGAALYIPVKVLDRVIVDTTRTINLLLLTGSAAVFALNVYVVLVWFMGVKELDTFVNLVKGIFKRVSGLQSRIKTEEIVQEPGS